MRTFRRIVWPLILPGVASGVVLAFITSDRLFGIDRLLIGQAVPGRDGD